jgi:hypothetical protein
MRALGFEGPFAGGKHPYMIRKGVVLAIPNPHRREIGTALLSRILKEAGISRAEWEHSKL